MLRLLIPLVLLTASLIAQEAPAISSASESTNTLLLVHEYVDLLKAVARASDAHELYHSSMNDQILQVPTENGFDYQIVGGKKNQTMHHLTNDNAMRYCNWKDHGSPTSNSNSEDSTENGTYRFSDDDQLANTNDDAEYQIAADGDGLSIIHFPIIKTATSPLMMFGEEGKVDEQKKKTEQQEEAEHRKREISDASEGSSSLDPRETTDQTNFRKSKSLTTVSSASENQLISKKGPWFKKLLTMTILAAHAFSAHGQEIALDGHMAQSTDLTTPTSTLHHQFEEIKSRQQAECRQSWPTLAAYYEQKKSDKLPSWNEVSHPELICKKIISEWTSLSDEQDIFQTKLLLTRSKEEYDNAIQLLESSFERSQRYDAAVKGVLTYCPFHCSLVPKFDNARKRFDEAVVVTRINLLSNENQPHHLASALNELNAISTDDSRKKKLTKIFKLFSKHILTLEKQIAAIESLPSDNKPQRFSYLNYADEIMSSIPSRWQPLMEPFLDYLDRYFRYLDPYAFRHNFRNFFSIKNVISNFIQPQKFHSINPSSFKDLLAKFQKDLASAKLALAECRLQWATIEENQVLAQFAEIHNQNINQREDVSKKVRIQNNLFDKMGKKQKALEHYNALKNENS